MEWISVKEIKRLPESLDDVLFSDGKVVYKGYRLECLDEDQWYSMYGSSINEVTHWMSLPQPPEE